MGFEALAIKVASSIALTATKKIVVPTVIKGSGVIIGGVAELAENSSNLAQGRLKSIKDFWSEKQQAKFLKLFEKESEKHFKEFVLIKAQCGLPNSIFVAYSPRAAFFLDDNHESPFSLMNAGNYYYLYSSYRDGLIGKIKVNECKTSKRGLDFTNLQAVQLLECFIGERRIGNIQIVKRKHFKVVGTMSVSVGNVRGKMDPEENSWTNPLFEEISLESQIRNNIGTYSVINFKETAMDRIDNIILAYSGILIARFLYHDIDFKKR
ncbi:MAG: hypothetical protein K5879_03830 [Lachnospiraceae bacterium]|nr:hypothetical protein [Lachnospiraceae bacterium]